MVYLLWSILIFTCLLSLAFVLLKLYNAKRDEVNTEVDDFIFAIYQSQFEEY